MTDGLPGSGDTDDKARPLQTLQSKFLDAVRAYAEKKYLELVVDNETPNSGYGYIQKKDGFSNLYSFHFEFTNEAALFFLGTEKVGSAAPEMRRDAQLRGSAELESVLDEIKLKIDAASKVSYPELGAFSKTSGVPGPLTSLQKEPEVVASGPSVERKTTARVFGQDQVNTKSEIKTTYHRPSRLPGIVASLVIIALLFLFFVPVLQYTASAVCPANWPLQCTGLSNATYYVSITNHYFGVGGEYFPPGQGWSVDQFVGEKALVSGGLAYGFGVWQYYFRA